MKSDWALTRAFVEAHPREAARVLEGGDPVVSAAVLARCPSAATADGLKRMDPFEATRVLVRLPDEAASAVLRDLPLGSASLLLRLAGDAERERMLSAVPGEVARPLRLALDHPADTAGALMDVAMLAVPVDTNVGEARERVRRRPSQARFYLYVVDNLRKPVGVITLRELMHLPRQTSLVSVMHSPVAQIPARARVETILAHPGWRELHALPVVDDEGVLVGLLRRETFERLRAEKTTHGPRSGTGLGVALAEMLWTLSATVVGELAAAARPQPQRHGKGSHEEKR